MRGDLCGTERDGGSHSGTTEDIPKHVPKRGKCIYKSHTSFPVISIVSGGGIALKTVQVNGAIMSSQLILLSSRVEKATRSVYKNVI